MRHLLTLALTLTLATLGQPAASALDVWEHAYVSDDTVVVAGICAFPDVCFTPPESELRVRTRRGSVHGVYVEEVSSGIVDELRGLVEVATEFGYRVVLLDDGVEFEVVLFDGLVLLVAGNVEDERDTDAIIGILIALLEISGDGVDQGDGALIARLVFDDTDGSER